MGGCAIKSGEQGGLVLLEQGGDQGWQVLVGIGIELELGLGLGLGLGLVLVLGLGLGLEKEKNTIPFSILFLFLGNRLVLKEFFDCYSFAHGLH